VLSGARSVFNAVLTALAVGCAAGSNPAASPEPAPPFHAASLYATLQNDAESFTFEQGQWVESLGDAPFYGLAFYAHAAPGSPQEPAWQARAQSARLYALGLLTNADFFTGDLQQMVMSALGLIDYIDATGDRQDLPVLDTFLDRFDTLVKLIGWYIDAASDRSWALGTYGPTSISALVGLLNAQYALLVGGPRAADRRDWALEMAQHIDDRALTGAYYAFGAAGHQQPSLYPNVAMIAFQARLYELSHDEAHRTRALALYDAIQPLRLPDGRYYSEYDAVAFGAKTDDFSTLSSQNYTMLALLLLYEMTGKAHYVAEADTLLDALAPKIYGTWCLSQVHHESCMPACGAPEVCVIDACEGDACHEGLLHHFIDGRAALPSDPTFFCSGCNLQTLYVLWYRQARTPSMGGGQ
jgi:hypothetical protein